MAVKFPYITAFICEKVLQEQDGILSAIRIADIFKIPPNTPEDAALSFSAVISLKAFPVPEEPFEIGVTLVGPTGERERLPSPPGMPASLRERVSDLSVPGGINLVLNLHIKPRISGTSFLEVDVDGETVVRLPITVQRSAEEQKS